MRRDSNRAVATDRDGHEIHINDNMKESEGEVGFAVRAYLLNKLMLLRVAKDVSCTFTSHSMPFSIIVILPRMEVSS